MYGIQIPRRPCEPCVLTSVFFFAKIAILQGNIDFAEYSGVISPILETEKHSPVPTNFKNTQETVPNPAHVNLKSVADSIRSSKSNRPFFTPFERDIGLVVVRGKEEFAWFSGYTAFSEYDT